MDPGNCQLADDDGNSIEAVASSYFHQDDADPVRYYSYETCQHSNTFSDTELDPQACNDQHSTVVADHCLSVAHPPALDSCPCIAMPDPHPFVLDDGSGQVAATIGGVTMP